MEFLIAKKMFNILLLKKKTNIKRERK